MRIIAAVTSVLFFYLATIHGSLCCLRLNWFAASQCQVLEPCPQPDLESCSGCGYEFPQEDISGGCPVEPEWNCEPQQPVVIICSVCILSEPAFTDRCIMDPISPRFVSTLFERRLTPTDESDRYGNSAPHLRNYPSNVTSPIEGRYRGVHPTIATTVLLT